MYQLYEEEWQSRNAFGNRKMLLCCELETAHLWPLCGISNYKWAAGDIRQSLYIGLHCTLFLWLLGLEHDFATLLHGQHLVSDTVVRSVRGHLHNQNPSKALVLSFHGCTGCGKNFVSKIIAKNLFLRGMTSKFVHLYISSYHFPHADSVELYKVNYLAYHFCLFH